ncbi:MAG: iron-sulfur cluster assembly scaffold protein, partial [Candidatus Nealsonbacteria bacterium]|nr:iron-sulfur cluster assembly scaffold protein [Candidatus Nealsonbacteria bacterium]
EEGIAEDINKISKKLFNLNVKIRRLLGRKTIIVSLYSARLARLFKKLFNNGAGNKMLPDFIMNLPAKKQIPLIYSLWRGDGYINVDRVGPRAGYSTISYKLAQQIKMLLLRQKIIPSIYKEKAREIRGLKHREAYRIHIGQRDSLKRLALILGIKYYPKSYISEKGWLDNNFLYTPITGIIKKQYQGKVYNLEVESSHSFTSEAFCVHNCGDIMYLYLKIEKNKAGKEIIKDIKFETFGCTVAIANTSLLTTMVKGKTLEYASKITKEDLIKKFKQVPLIKIHCSLLAVDALSEAIYDYFKKQGRPITPELQAKHERIEKEEKEIEHKHEGLVELEEKLHKK